MFHKMTEVENENIEEKRIVTTEDKTEETGLARRVSSKVIGVTYDPRLDTIAYDRYDTFKKLHQKFHDAEENVIRKTALGGNRSKLIEQNDLFNEYVQLGRKGKDAFFDLAEDKGYAADTTQLMWAFFDSKHKRRMQDFAYDLSFNKTKKVDLTIKDDEPFEF